MKYFQPYGVSDPDAPYINGNPSTGTMGSIPPAESIEHPQREIVEMIKDAGLTPTQTDLKQLAKGIQNGKVNFGIDVGTVNNLQITLSPVPLYVTGMPVRVLAVQSNTGPAVLNVNAIGPKKIRRPGDSDLLANDISAGGIVTMVYNEGLQGGAGAWELQGVSGGGQTDSGAGGWMKANMHLYVNYAIGNDANDGTANDAQHALKQIQKAVDIAWTYRPSQFTLTIHIADSLLYGPVRTPQWQGPNLIFVGNVTTPANVLVTGVPAGANTKHAFVVAGNQTCTIQGIKVTMGVVDSDHQGVGWYFGMGTIITMNNCESGFCDGYHVLTYGDLAFSGFYRISGSTFGQILCCISGSMTSFQTNFQIMNAITCVYFIHVSICFSQWNGTYTTFTNPGLVTSGYKYYCEANGVLGTLGGGPNFFPGPTAGFVNTGGQYS